MKTRSLDCLGLQGVPPRVLCCVSGTWYQLHRSWSTARTWSSLGESSWCQFVLVAFYSCNNRKHGRHHRHRPRRPRRQRRQHHRCRPNHATQQTPQPPTRLLSKAGVHPRFCATAGGLALLLRLALDHWQSTGQGCSLQLSVFSVRGLPSSLVSHSKPPSARHGSRGSHPLTRQPPAQPATPLRRDLHNSCLAPGEQRRLKGLLNRQMRPPLATTARSRAASPVKKSTTAKGNVLERKQSRISEPHQSLQGLGHNCSGKQRTLLRTFGLTSPRHPLSAGHPLAIHRTA